MDCPSSIVTVADALRGGAEMAAPVFRGERGHPVGFARKYGGPLCALTGDEGARSPVASRKGALQLVDVDDPGVARDIDWPDDLHRRTEMQNVKRISKAFSDNSGRLRALPQIRLAVAARRRSSRTRHHDRNSPSDSGCKMRNPAPVAAMRPEKLNCAGLTPSAMQRKPRVRQRNDRVA
jgi:hypothetical protein